MTKIITKKRYEKPFVMVYELISRQILLQSSLPTEPDPNKWPGGEPW